MKGLITKLDKFCRKVVNAERIVGGAILFVMLVVCFGAVIMRYFVGRPWVWSDEIILILLAILGYIAISIDVYRDAHVALTLVYEKVSPRMRKVLDVVRHILIGVFYTVCVFQLKPIIAIKLNKKLAATSLSQAVPFLFVIVLCVAMIFFCLLNLAKTFANMPRVEADDFNLTRSKKDNSHVS